MTNPNDKRSNEEEPSPSMSRSAEDNLSNSDGPLLSNKKRDKDPAIHRSQMNSPAMLLHQDNWHKSYGVSDNYCPSDEKKNHRFIWMLSLILAVIGLCNLILNMTIFIVLRMSRGMEALEVIPERDLTKFYGNTDLDRVCLQKGVCEGFGDEPIELIGDAGGVNIQVANRQHSMTWSNLQVLKNGTSVSRVNSFEVKDPRSGSPIFSTDFPNFSLPLGVKRIEVTNNTQTHRIAAPKKQDLSITSDESISLHGAEGMSIDSKDINWLAKNDILLNSRDGDIVIEAKDSINMLQIPIALNSLPTQSNEMLDQYKVCVCMPDGKLFLVPVNGEHSQVNCATVSKMMESDPCAM